MSRIHVIAIIYIVVSVFFGPGIVIYALGRDGRVGMDCSDQTWMGVSQAYKDAFYHQATAIMTTGSIAMLVIGVVLLFLVLNRGRDGYELAVFMVFILLGYLLVLLSANTWNCM